MAAFLLSITTNLNIMKSVKFDSKKFDALICLNSKLPKSEFFDSFTDLPLLAADGAALRLNKIGKIPDYIVGDLDSFYAEADTEDFKKSKIIHIPEQESNDFEKILKFSQSLGFLNLLICGFHGGELEHTLNNTSVFLRYARLMNLCIYDKKRYGFACSESFELNCKTGDIISLIPQPKIELKTTNLKWELNYEFLEMSIREGARNVALSDKVTFEIIEGTMILFVPAQIPYSPDYYELSTININK